MMIINETYLSEILGYNRQEITTIKKDGKMKKVLLGMTMVSSVSFLQMDIRRQTELWICKKWHMLCKISNLDFSTTMQIL